MTRTIAVFVTWNCAQHAVRLAHSLLLESKDQPLDILQVDNASTDGSADSVASISPTIRQIRHTENLGGAGGFAAGMAVAVAEGYEFVWLLDGDACPRKGALVELIKELARHPDAAVAGSQIVIAALGNRVQEIGARIAPWTGRLHFLGLGDQVDPLRPAEDVDYVPACSALARVAVVRAVGGFSPGLFVFYDDIAWCSRIRRAGWRIRTAPRSMVEHQYHGAKPLLPWRVYYGWRNRTLWHLSIPNPIQRIISLAWWCGAMAHTRENWRATNDLPLVAAGDQAISDVLIGRLGRRDDLPDLNRTAAPQEGLWAPIPCPNQAVLFLSGPLNQQLEALAWASKKPGIWLRGGDVRLLAALTPGLNEDRWKSAPAELPILTLNPRNHEDAALLWRDGQIWDSVRKNAFRQNFLYRLRANVSIILQALDDLLSLLNSPRPRL